MFAFRDSLETAFPLTASRPRISKDFAWLDREPAAREPMPYASNPHIDPAELPVDLAFTAAVHAMCEAMMPGGYDTVTNYYEAPRTLLELNDCMMSGDCRMVVWSGPARPNIYGTAEDNCAFRAWHDYVHWTFHLPMTLAGEASTAYLQVWQIMQKYGHDQETEAWCAMILCEVIGHALEQIRNGDFPSDGRAFTQDNANVYMAMATRLCAQFSKPVTSQDVLYVAEQAFGRPYN